MCRRRRWACRSPQNGGFHNLDRRQPLLAAAGLRARDRLEARLPFLAMVCLEPAPLHFVGGTVARGFVFATCRPVPAT